MIIADEAKISHYEAKGIYGKETLYDLFLKNVKRFPHQESLVDPANKEDLCGMKPQRYTLSQLEEKVNQLATVLRENGIEKDDIVAVQLPNTTELVVTYLALLQLGAIVNPLPVQYRKHEYVTMLNFVRAKSFITMQEFLKYKAPSAILEAKAEIDSLESVFAWGDNLPDEVIALEGLEKIKFDKESIAKNYQEAGHTANDIFSICWTSGTESTPKGVPRSHNEWILSAYASVDAGNFQEDTILLVTFPIINMAGIGGMFVPWLLTSCKLVMHHPFDLPTFLKQITVEKISYTLAPPALLNMMLQNEEIDKMADFSSLKSIGSGSAPLSTWMVNGWKDKYDIDIINYFGSNEGATFISDPKDIPNPSQRANYFPRLGVKGFEWSTRIAHTFESKIVDPETGITINESGIPGEMRIKGATVLPRYWRQDELAETPFDEDGFFCTGDIFEIIEENNEQKFYRFVGRLKEIIIRGGMNISPGELEELLQTHPKVQEVSVIGVPDEDIGERVCACIVLNNRRKTINLDEMKQFFKANDYAVYKTPEYIYFLDELPRNPVGKVMKGQLLDSYLGKYSLENVKKG